MTKKDYVAIAAMLNELWLDKRNDMPTMSWVIGGLADIFEDENSCFDRARFVSAALRGK